MKSYPRDSIHGQNGSCHALLGNRLALLDRNDINRRNGRGQDPDVPSPRESGRTPLFKSTRSSESTWPTSQESSCSYVVLLYFLFIPFRSFSASAPGKRPWSREALSTQKPPAQPCTLRKIESTFRGLWILLRRP